MWNWDQGRLDYFQFDNLKKIARFALSGDLRLADRAMLASATGLRFLPDDDQYPPWRNYSRVFQLSMICAEQGEGSQATPLAEFLASDGGITTDEYFHFLSRATTDPSPALSGWRHDAALRYPLLFSLKFMLARAAINLPDSDISEIIAAYNASGFSGDEDQSAFVELINAGHNSPASDRKAARYRQAAESIQVIGQISYLSLKKRRVTVSLSSEDAANLFEQMNPINGAAEKNGADEVFRLTGLFKPAVAELDLDYAATAISDIDDSGFSSDIAFAEGAKSRKTHLVIERNGKIRSEFFKANPSPVCDFCALDTCASYPWTSRILDIHHLLPLCSSLRTSKEGTLLGDLVAVCPTCHRGVHRYYDRWLKDAGRKDFKDAEQAKTVYEEAKSKFGGIQTC